MRNITAIMQRELLALFCSPIAYVVLAGFLLITGIGMLVGRTFEPGKPATLRAIFELAPFVLTIIIPAITMRAISEEYRTGTIESLTTAPVTESEFVLGKYCAGVVFLLVMLLGTSAYLVLMEVFGNPDWGASLSAYLGLLFLGMLYLAVGLMTSSLTSNQIIAWISAAIPLLLLAFLTLWIVTKTDGVARVIAQQMNFKGRFDEFARGIVSLGGVVFFVGSILVFLFITIKIVESRRWR